jgi:1-acyl-sn-glycerol-3-phosphate acyltransferase
MIKAKLPRRTGAADTRTTPRLPVNGQALAALVRAAVPRPRDLVPRPPFPYGAPSVPNGIEPQQARSKVGADFETDWARKYPARVARVMLVEGVVRPAVTALAAPIVLGRDRLEEMDGPVIFVANHHSHVDTPLLQSVIPEPWRHRLVIGAAADYFFPNRLKGTLSALVIGAVPIERTRVSRRSADDAARLIGDGWNFLIFPEGGRSPDGWGQPFQPGAAYLSMRCGVPVVPIYIGGTTRILRKGNTWPKLSITRVVFGSAMTAGEGESSRRFTARIETTISSLGDEGRTDWYQARKRLHAGKAPSLQGPADGVGAWRRTWELGDRSPIRRRQTRAWPDLGDR